MNPWQPISTAPKPDSNSPLIDLYAKRWISKTDTFEYMRFVDCSWSSGGMGWRNLPQDWFPIYWMPVPPPPIQPPE